MPIRGGVSSDLWPILGEDVPPGHDLYIPRQGGATPPYIICMYIIYIYIYIYIYNIWGAPAHRNI